MIFNTINILWKLNTSYHQFVKNEDNVVVALGSGYTYLQYFKYHSANKKLDDLIASKQLPEHLYQLH
jgi:hypothetical protein